MGVFPGVGGVERATTVLANKFIDEGHDVSLLSFWKGDDSMLNTLSNQARLVKFNAPINTKENKEKLHDYLTINDIDVLVNQWCVPYYVSQLISSACKNTKCKYVAVHHNLPTTNGQIKNLEDKIRLGEGIKIVNKLKLSLVALVSRLSLRYTYEKCDKFVLLSESFAPITKKFMFLKSSPKLTSISNPITIEEGKDSTPTQKENIILWVGRIDYIQKRPDRLIEVWRLLESRYPDWKLQIIGDGPYRDGLQKLIDDNKLRNVTIEGFQNPVEYYKKAQILLLTSDFEGFGLVIIEGMNFGVIPVVYGSYDAVYDIIEDGKDGFITKQPFSAKEMANKIYEIIEDDDKRRLMSHNTEIKSEKFSLDSIYKKWMDLFSEH